MNGIIIVDKPTDWTSHDIVAKLRGALKIKRVGHGGTLDPMATGVLPVFIGRATRAAMFCENAEKEYVARLRLGLVTDTQDITGSTLSESMVTVRADELKAVVKSFSGAQKQVPPMYSAIKQGGKKLYELARRGIEVPRPERDIFISAIEVLDCDGTDFLLRIVCSKGTYIRTLCHDIGAALGCGGTMSSLRRTGVGSFKIDTAFPLGEILEAVSSGKLGECLLPVDSLFSEFPLVVLDEKESQRAKNGALRLSGNLADGKYRFYDPNDEFLLLGEVVDGKANTIKSFYEV